MPTDDIRMDGQGDLRAEPEELLEQEEHPGGGRFNRRILITFAAVAIVSGVVVALGVESSGIGQSAGLQKLAEDPGASARNGGEVADLAAHGGKQFAAPTFVPPPAVVATAQAPIQQTPPRPPSRYAQWAEEKYMKALESPQMVSAFHGGGTLEISRADRSRTRTSTLEIPSIPP
jgi:hypothetical protein